jgi:hypothetical protein
MSEQVRLRDVQPAGTVRRGEHEHILLVLRDDGLDRDQPV